MPRPATRLSIAALLSCAAIVAGCGASGAGAGGSQVAGASPAAIAPASTIAYLDLAVRPAGALGSEVRSGLAKLLGFDPGPRLQSLVSSVLGGQLGTSYAAGLKPWLGERVGLVVTALSPTAIAGIAPTSNPSGAASFINRVFARLGAGPVQSTTVSGHRFKEISAGGIEILGGTVGHDLVVGGTTAVGQIISASHGSSLASVPQFAAAMNASPAGSIVRLYARIKPLLSAYTSLPILSGLLGQPAGAGASSINSILRGELAKTPNGAAIFADLAVTGSRLQVDDDSLGNPAATRSGPPSPGAGSLPAGTWLGLDTGGKPLSAARIHALTGAMKANMSSLRSMRVRSLRLTRGLQGTAAIPGMPGLGGTPGIAVNPLAIVQRQLGFALSDLVASYGPLRLAVSGTAVRSLTAQLALRPSDPAAAARALTGLQRHLATVGQASSHGSGSFTFTDPRLHGRVLSIVNAAGQVQARFGPGTAAPSSLSPSSGTLASSQAYQQAAAQLPAGSRAVLYVSGPGILALVRSAPKSGTQTDQRVEAILSRLSYLIAGGQRGAARIVLGLR